MPISIDSEAPIILTVNAENFTELGNIIGNWSFNIYHCSTYPMVKLKITKTNNGSSKFQEPSWPDLVGFACNW